MTLIDSNKYFSDSSFNGYIVRVGVNKISVSASGVSYISPTDSFIRYGNLSYFTPISFTNTFISEISFTVGSLLHSSGSPISTVNMINSGGIVFGGNLKIYIESRLYDNCLILSRVVKSYDSNWNYSNTTIYHKFYPLYFDNRIETTCCLLVCCEPTKYKLI